MTSEPTIDLPNRVVVGTNGAYWRDYGDHYSMCPVSDDNEPVEFAAVYSRSRPGDGVYVSQEWLDERMADSMRERAELAAEKARVAMLQGTVQQLLDAEPRWPSGPDAEQRLNAAADKAGRKHPDDAGFAADILAALQEKRDHAE